MSHANEANGPPRRRGFTLIEMTACVTVLIVAAALVTELVVAVAAETRELERRAVALREADNALERLAADASAWVDVPASAEGLSDAARSTLPGGTMAVRVGPEADGLTRLEVEVRWVRRPGQPTLPVHLVTWGVTP